MVVQCSRGWSGRCAKAMGTVCRCRCGGANHGKSHRPAVSAAARGGERGPVDGYAVGTRVRSLRDFADVPAGTTGVVDEEFPIGIVVRWDPPSPRSMEGGWFLARSGFDKATELQYLEALP